MIKQSYGGYNLARDQASNFYSFGYIEINEKTDSFEIHDEIDNDTIGYYAEKHLDVSFNLFFQTLNSEFSSDNVNSFPVNKEILEDATTKEIIFLNYLYTYFGYSTYSAIDEYLAKNKIEKTSSFF